MRKDDEESKKKVFSHIKRIKENAVRRNRSQLLDEPGSVDPAIASNSTGPRTRSPSTSLAATNSNRNTASEANPQGVSQPLVDLKASTGESSSAAKPANRKNGEPEPATGASEENNCSICLRENTNPALCNECFHCFCFPCIQQWSEQSNQCPVCRREYSLILYNIRSESEFDQLPVQPRRRVSEFEIILPLNNFFEMDEALTRFLQVPPLLPIPHPLPNAYLHGNPAVMMIPPTGMAGRARDLENAENMISLSVTNYNQPDANGNRVIQRTFYFAEPSASDPGAQRPAVTNMSTPSTSLEQNQPQFDFQSIPLQDPNLMQQRPQTVVFNPSYGAEPYRSLVGGALDRFLLPNFSNMLTTPFGMAASDGVPATRGEQPMQTLDPIFEQIFNDLTRFPVGVRTQRFLTRRSFPTTEISANSTQLDSTESTESVEEPPAQPARSGQVRRGRGRRRGQVRRGRGRGRANSSNRGNSRPSNRGGSRGGRGSRRRGSRN